MLISIYWDVRTIEGSSARARGWALTRLPILPLALASLLGIILPVPASADDPTVMVSGDDPEMNAAISRARATLPGFWQKFAEHPANEKDFSVKLAISDGQLTEHFWCGPVEKNGDGYACAIANEPQDVKTVEYGQRMTIDPAIISDWMYMRDGKIVGGETIRVLLPRMNEDEAAQVKAMLADP